MSEPLVAVTPVAAPLAPARRELPIKRWVLAAVCAFAIVAGGATLTHRHHTPAPLPPIRQGTEIPPAPKAPAFDFPVPPPGPLVAPQPTLPPQVIVPPAPKKVAPVKKKVKRPAK